MLARWPAGAGLKLELCSLTNKFRFNLLWNPCINCVEFDFFFCLLKMLEIEASSESIPTESNPHPPGWIPVKGSHILSHTGSCLSTIPVLHHDGPLLQVAFKEQFNFSLKYLLYQDSKETDHKADAGALFCLSWHWRSMSGHKNSYLHWGMSCCTSARTSLEVPPTLHCCTSHQVVDQYWKKDRTGVLSSPEEKRLCRGLIQTFVI